MPLHMLLTMFHVTKESHIIEDPGFLWEYFFQMGHSLFKILNQGQLALEGQ
jgi:hypothetical protein